VSLRTLQRRVAKLEQDRKPRASPIVIAFGTFDAFAMTAYLDVEKGTLSGEFLFIVDVMRRWETDRTWEVARATA
jgi:hypothetical protein